jgi:hypothetical protein
MFNPILLHATKAVGNMQAAAVAAAAVAAAVAAADAAVLAPKKKTKANFKN